MSEQVPEGWQVRKLGELGEFKNGINKPKEAFGSGTKFVNISDAYPINLDCRSLKRLEVTAQEIINYNLEMGDLVFVRSSVKLEGLAVPTIFSGYEEAVVFCGFMIRYRVHDETVLPNYLRKYLLDESSRIRMQRVATGGANININQESLSAFEVLLPPLPEQKKIASILTSVDEVIEKTQSQIDKLQDLKKGTMNELLTKGIGHTEFKDSELGRIPKSWEVKKLDDVCIKIWIGLVTTMTKFYVENGVPLIRNSDIKESGIKIQNLIRLDQKFADEHKGRMVKEGDVVTVHTGDVGTSCVISEKLSLAHGFATLNSRVNGKIISPQFYATYLNSVFFDAQVEKVITGDGRDNLNLKDFVQLITVIPPLIEQRKITTITASLDAQIGQKSRILHQTQSLKKSLMQDLLTGKVRVSVN
jgi:type I restriction enzyme, S subunit